MTARADAERRVRSTVRALDAALSTDPIDRARVTELGTRLADAVDGLPTDSRFEHLDRAVSALATDVLSWSYWDLPGARDDLRNAIDAFRMQRQALRIDGMTAPF